MLTHLSIRDIVLIDRLELDFLAGLSVLTGETGAGKSILLDAFSLALGARGDGSLVRQGQAQGQVTASFDVPGEHPVRDILKAHDLACDGELILRRVQMADGRTRALINDQPVSVQIQKAVGACLVEIHGQHDDRALMDPASHRKLLDAFGGLDALTCEVGKRHGVWRKRVLEQSEHLAKLDQARREGDWLRHAVEELAALSPQVGEEARLADRRMTMMQAEKVASDLKEAYDALEGPASPTSILAGILRRLERRGGQSSLIQPIVQILEEALHGIEAAHRTVEAALRDADLDPRELERVEERLFALRAAARKYECMADALPDIAARFAADLSVLDEGEERLVRLQEAVAEARAAFIFAAADLSVKRATAAAALDRAVDAELIPLKLDRARFITTVETAPQSFSAEGCDRVEFWVQTNPGTKAGPMMRVASGGELSRFMLALKVVLADRGSAPTLVFDEIDAGVGGAVADAIGSRLGRLAARVQVLSVTHAPQIAAQAHHHFLISKQDARKGQVATTVRFLDPAMRREEIARMLAGAEVTDEARAAASRLLLSAQ